MGMTAGKEILTSPTGSPVESSSGGDVSWGQGVSAETAFLQVFQQAVGDLSSSGSTRGTAEGKFVQVLKTLEDDEVRSLRRLKVGTIKEAMRNGDRDALRVAQHEFKLCSEELRQRSTTLGLIVQPGAPVPPALSGGGGKMTGPAAPPLFTAPTPPPSSSATPITAPVSALQAPEPEPAPAHPGSANRFGVSPLIWQSVQRNDFVRNTLLTFPLEAVAMYRDTPFEEKRLLLKQLQEKTKVMWVTVDHREAFINGNAYGRDTFDFLRVQIEEEAKGGKLPREAARRRIEAVEVFRGMTSDQRKAFVDLLEMEVGIAKL